MHNNMAFPTLPIARRLTMSFFDSEKLQAAHKANLDLLEQVNSKLLKGFEQLSHLQIAALTIPGRNGRRC